MREFVRVVHGRVPLRRGYVEGVIGCDSSPPGVFRARDPSRVDDVYEDVKVHPRRRRKKSRRRREFSVLHSHVNQG